MTARSADYVNPGDGASCPQAPVTAHIIRAERLKVVPVELSEANALVAAWHRHHEPAQGHRFSLGVVTPDGTLHGAAIIGRPPNRNAGSPRAVLEVVRLVTDGTPNACSALYAAAARVGRAMGFERIQTYVLADEPGTSLLASGWTYEGLGKRPEWHSRPARRRDELGRKGRWAKTLNPAQPVVLAPLPVNGDQDVLDFGEAS